MYFMRPKERGYILSVDQASNVAGVSLWYDGDLVATTELVSVSAKDPFARRVQGQLAQLTAFLDLHLPSGVQIDTAVFEGVRMRVVIAVIGAFLCCPRIDSKLNEKHDFVESSIWKTWAKMRGATGPHKLIKGVKALTEAGWDVVKHPVTSDDIADSILIYCAWRDRELISHY